MSAPSPVNNTSSARKSGRRKGRPLGSISWTPTTTVFSIGQKGGRNQDARRPAAQTAQPAAQ